MSSSFGKMERAILVALADAEHGRLTAVTLAERVGVSVRQILSVVRALEERGSVFLTQENLTPQGISTARYGDLTITSNVRMAGTLMSPTPVLIVWLPESRVHYLSHCLSTTAARGGSGSPEMVAEYERLTGQPSPTRRAIRHLPYRSRKRYPEFKRSTRMIAAGTKISFLFLFFSERASIPSFRTASRVARSSI